MEEVCWNASEGAEPDRIFPLIYDELRSIARSRLRRGGGEQLLQTTALVHETYMRLRSQERISVADRSHFLAIAARTLRRILVDHARAGSRIKRGAPWKHVQLSTELTAGPGPSMDLLALEEALTKLGARDERRAHVVELRFFGGLSVEETAEVLGVSARTVEDDWAIARAFLHRELEGKRLA